MFTASRRFGAPAVVCLAIDTKGLKHALVVACALIGICVVGALVGDADLGFIAVCGVMSLSISRSLDIDGSRVSKRLQDPD